jgi:energy-coupling factor transporter ATP-binding protein EcfA2
MLTQLRLRNFKQFDDVDIELGRSVVFIGPNNSGKTSALQALALWDVGLRLWNAKRGGKASPKKRPGVMINRRDLIAIPIPAANLLWRGTHTRDSQKVNGKQQTRNIRIDVVVEGITNDKAWSCGLEFDYSNEESFGCRPLRSPGFENTPVGKADYSEIPDEATALKISYLPPMSGLADREFIKQQGEIGFLIGQGQTAQILRNLCHQLFQNDTTVWKNVAKQIESLFGAKLLDPEYIPERSEIVMRYEERGTRLDLSSAGRGLQQTLLLLAYLYANPNTVLLLDEPDAHLETLRQREIYRLLTSISDQQNSQIIAASHSEVVLNEAAGSGKVVAFVGKPHVLNDKGSQVLKSLTSIGWDQYYQAEAKGWALYLEGPSDLAILQAFAETLDHPAAKHLERPFVHYVSNHPQKARDHYFGLREAKGDLHGVAIFDRLDKKLDTGTDLVELMWSRREIENYFCTEDVLLVWVRPDQPDSLFDLAEADKREPLMREAIDEVTRVLEIDETSPWSHDVKATDEVLDRIFRVFFKKLKLPITFRKSDYHVLAKLVPKDDIDPEITEKLDAIVEVAGKVQTSSE